MPTDSKPFVKGVTLLLAWAATAAHAANLPPDFVRAIKEAAIPLTDVAVTVQVADARYPVLAHRAGQSMNPASVMKLLTSVVALEKLGPAFVWKTDIWASGAIREGTLWGDLVIKGYGDPTLTLERLWLLQREIRSHGITHINGNLILDTGFFALAPSDPGAFDGEPLALYNALPGPLLANYSATSFRLKPVNDQVEVRPDIVLPRLNIESRIALDDAECGDWKDRLNPIEVDANRTTLTFGGTYARSCGEKQLSLNVLAPHAHFDRVFRALWTEAGRAIDGVTVLGSAPSDGAPLVSFSSVPLAEALRNQNKFSNNLITRNVFLTLGAAHLGPPATLAKSAHAVRSWVTEKHLSAPELVLENGAGLSRIERISANTLVRVLQLAYTSPYFSELESSLPIWGVDGTLRKRIAEPSLVGRAHLKTGSLQDVRAIAGYVTNRDGKRLILVMMINHPNAARAERAQQALVAWAYAYRPPGAKPRRGK